MARRPHELESGPLELDHLHTRTTALAGLASKATDASTPTATAPSPSRRSRAAARAARRRTLRSFALISIAVLALLFAGGAMLTKAGGSALVNDPLADSVRAVAGAPALGPRTGLRLNADFVDITANPSGNGYWTVASDGGVFSFGDARFHGSTGGIPLAAPVVGIAPTATGEGYWLVASDGGVFAFGDAHFHGSLGASGPTSVAPISAMAPTPSGNGYWLVAADGGVFAFGDATFQGAATGVPHGAPIVAIAPTHSGFGYYLLAADGGVFAFGDAHFAGSAVDGKHIATGVAVPSNGHGYMVSRSDGSVAGFGGAPSVTAPLDPLANQHPAIGIAANRGGGAWLALSYSPPPPPPDTGPSQDPFLKCTRAHESDSAGGYHARSSDGLYHGAYQFLQSTWNNVARAAGRPDLVGVDPANALVADQDQLALFLYHHAGAAPWGGRCAGLA